MPLLIRWQAGLIFSDDHPWHAKSVDDGLETLQGRVKVRKGKRWNERDVELHTACAPLFDEARATQTSPQSSAKPVNDAKLSPVCPDP